jgi:hypothetical protein
MESTQNMILTRGKELLTTEKLLRGDLSLLTNEEAVLVFAVLDLLEKKVMKERKTVLRDRLLALAKKDGKEDQKKGHYHLELTQVDTKVTAEKKRGKLSVDVAAAQLVVDRLAGKVPGIEKLIKQTPSVDTDVLEALMTAKLISESDVDLIVSEGDPTWALKVKAPTVEALVKGLK